MKRNIALVWGGYSSEIVVSQKSMRSIDEALDKDRYNVYKMKLVSDSWTIEHDGRIYDVDKNDFSFFDELNNKKINLEFAYIIIHGTPGEDGKLQGYLDMLKIPYSNAGVLSSSLTMNKYVCNNYLRNFGFNVADSIRIKKEDTCNEDGIIDRLGLPVFVKPNTGGSSFATTKVKTKEQLLPAIHNAFKETADVIVESFVAGREVTCGCYKIGNKAIALPITEAISKNEFFDYGAKYDGQVEEITPAPIGDKLTSEINKLTLEIYDLVDAEGIIRVDYIITPDNTPYLLEVNTTPGMATTSFVPQQIAAANKSMTAVLTDIIENEFANKMNHTMTNRFDDIAPLYDHQVKETIAEIMKDERFEKAVRYIMPDVDWDVFAKAMAQYDNKADFQNDVISKTLWMLGYQTAKKIKAEQWERIDRSVQHLFLSNHRDIVLDAGFLNILHSSKGLPTTEIAIGDNLLIHPWIEKLVRLNKSFIVRRGLPVREQLTASKHMSEYIHYCITQKGESIWMAQREGRAKDANDHTQIGLLKMLALAPEKMLFLDCIKNLNIIPLAISYEYDPCDYLKAQEFQMKRDNPEYKKSQQDDLINMEIGIMGGKGDVVFRFGHCINDKVNQITETDKREQVLVVAGIIDNEIHRNYEIFPGNYIALDLLNDNKEFATKYTNAEKKYFEGYIEKQIGRIDIPNKDYDFLRTTILSMYSNVLINHLKATEL